MANITPKLRHTSAFTRFGIPLVFFVSLYVCQARGQDRLGGRLNGDETPTRQNPDDIANSSPQSSGALKAETTLVPVRVVVRDAQGHAVTNLRKEDFKLFQDGKQQQIANFSVEIATAATKQNAATNSSIPAPTSESPASTFQFPTGFVALFFDDAHLSIQDLTRARDAAGKYLDTALKPSDRVAVLTVSGFTQLDFTDDRAKLHATLLKLLPHPVSAGDAASFDCPPMDFFEADAIRNQNDPQALSIATQDALVCAFNNKPGFYKQAQGMAIGAAERMMNQNDQQTEAVFRRLREIVRRVSVLSGQRSIVMISPGFIYPAHETELAEIMDHAIHSDIVINTLDAKRPLACL